MTRLPWAFSTFMTVLSAALPTSGSSIDPAEPPVRVRSEDGRVRLAVERGLQMSDTFRSLVLEIESSDVIVYIEDRRCEGPGYNACIFVAGSSAGTRYLRIALDAKQSMPHLLPSLAHELQHAVEIARAQEVIDSATLRSFYERT